MIKETEQLSKQGRERAGGLEREMQKAGRETIRRSEVS